MLKSADLHLRTALERLAVPGILIGHRFISPGDEYALLPQEAGALLKRIQPLKVRAMIALAITAGLRRGELIAARWKALDEAKTPTLGSEVVT